MTPEQMETSLRSHQEIIQQLLTNQEYLCVFVRKSHETWAEIGTELELINLRLAGLEHDQDSKYT